MGTKEIDSYFKDGFVVINVFTARDVNLILSEIEKYYSRIGKKHKVSISNLKSYHRLPISQDTHNLMMHPDTRQIKLKEKFIKKIQQNKIAKSITIALRKRPIDGESVEKFISKIVRNLEGLGENEIPTSTIGKFIMDGLANLDQVAYVRFASVYRNFKEAKDFEQFIGNLNVYKTE